MTIGTPFKKTLDFDAVNVAAGIRPEDKETLEHAAAMLETTVAGLLRLAIEDHIHPRLTDIKDTGDGVSSTLDGQTYDRGIIGGRITEYQGYATERDIDQAILDLDFFARVSTTSNPPQHNLPAI